MNLVCFFSFSPCLIGGIGSAIELAKTAPEIVLSYFVDLRPPLLTKIKGVSAAIFSKVATTACLALNVVEFLCYVILFIEMYKHTKRHVKLCLLNKPKLAKNKKRQNTISTVGHFVSWVTELIVFSGLAYTTNRNKDNVNNTFYGWLFFQVFLPSINYIVFPSVQVIASKELRAHVFNMEYFEEVCLCANCMSPNNVEAAAPQEFELQVIPNGHVNQM